MRRQPHGSNRLDSVPQLDPRAEEIRLRARLRRRRERETDFLFDDLYGRSDFPGYMKAEKAAKAYRSGELDFEEAVVQAGDKRELLMVLNRNAIKEVTMDDSERRMADHPVVPGTARGSSDIRDRSSGVRLGGEVA